jgi:hypothetical protein
MLQLKNHSMDFMKSNTEDICEELLNHFSSGWNQTHTPDTSHVAFPVYTGLPIIPSKTQKKVLTTLKRGLFISHSIQIRHEAALFILTTRHKFLCILATALQLASMVNLLLKNSLTQHINLYMCCVRLFFNITLE